MIALLVAGGNLIDKDILLKYSDYSDYIVCADFGIKNFMNLSLRVDLVVGDLDSSDQECLDYIAANNINLCKLDCDKDYTDTEYALNHLLKEGYDEVVLLAGSGTRLDHTMSNIFLLEKFFGKLNLKFIDNNNEIIYAEKGSYKLSKSNYKYLSLLAISDSIEISSKGLKYEVENFKIKRTSSLGVSNEILEEEAEIFVHRGKLLIIKSKD